MAKKMLIDAAHPEETRVVVVQDNRVTDFDFESSTKDRNRGNIYLAKVTRIEPSLQAAFVEYGGNRHGFLAFNEIHPDYYQIPIADKEALLEAQAAAQRSEELAIEAADKAAEEKALAAKAKSNETPSENEDTAQDAGATETEGDAEATTDTEDLPASAEVSEEGLEAASTEAEAEADSDSSDEDGDADADAVDDDESDEDLAPPQQAETVETNNADDTEEEIAEVSKVRRQKLRNYKIQEVIKRRQIILIQVVKEERGNKGAALTTYLSLAGRYCVLMPNTGRGGGISRKIANVTDRKRLKKVVETLDVPLGMGLIIRTAGAKRTKIEIKRDYEYLLRLWENVRSLTLESIAPTLVYEEGNLIKRSIRDLYSKDIDEIWVEGEEAYKEAKAFMRMLTPSHSKNVKRYKDNSSLFQRYQVERQLDEMFSPQVQLKSGGYLVINPTEALVSIDVNSGRSTKERSIEKTALNTNLEAAEEVARQCRMRDLAGLLVIDFIDMEENRNNRAVERKLKDSLKNDRARVQIGRISSFGLMEMSRQRMRSSVLEGTSTACTVCEGSGMVRSVESTTLRILRAIEDLALNGTHRRFTLRCAVETALYLLNNKRAQIQDLETRYDVAVLVEADKSLQGPQFEMIRGASRPVPTRQADTAVKPETSFVAPDAVEETEEKADDDETQERPKKRRRRRSRRGGDRDKSAQDNTNQDNKNTEETQDGESEQVSASDGNGEKEEGEQPRRRRRRGKRGGRRHNNKRPEDDTGSNEVASQNANTQNEDTSSQERHTGKTESSDAVKSDAAQANTKDLAPKGEAKTPAPSTHNGNGATANSNGQGDTAKSTPSAKPAESKPAKEKAAPTPAPVIPTPPPESSDQPAAPAKRGWWQRRSS